MLNTIFLVMATMIFGGSMDAIGAIKSISKALLNWADNIFKLFASTVASCLALNLTASDQYLSIVVSGKMFEKAYILVYKLALYWLKSLFDKFYGTESCYLNGFE